MNTVLEISATPLARPTLQKIPFDCLIDIPPTAQKHNKPICSSPWDGSGGHEAVAVAEISRLRDREGQLGAEGRTVKPQRKAARALRHRWLVAAPIRQGPAAPVGQRWHSY